MGQTSRKAGGVAGRLLLGSSVLAAAVLGPSCGGDTSGNIADQAAGSSGQSSGAATGSGATGSPEAGSAGLGGGASTPGGGAPPATGGAQGTGGAAAAGGTVASGGTAASAGAAAASSGGAGTGGSGGAAGAAGGPPEEFCTGETRVSFDGQTLSPPVTSAQSMLLRSCCFDYTIRLHTDAALGMDLVVDLGVMAGQTEAGEYVQGGSGSWVSAGVRPSTTEPEYASGNVSGTVRLFDAFVFDAPWELALCLEVDDPASALYGARIYVPRVGMAPYSGWSDYFEIYLLEDPTLTADDAAELPIDSLVLADEPLVDLEDMEFVEQATGWFGLNQAFLSGDTLRDELGQVSVFGLPFVVQSQGVRIYLGAFTSLVSSYLPPCPTITVENIEANGFTIEAPWSGSDPRSDPRLLQALAEAFRLVP